jgi:hypothetical protein
MFALGFGLLLLAAWLGFPFYWGWIHFSLWGPVIWSPAMAMVVVVTGWRANDDRIVATCLQALCFSAFVVFTVYFLGRLMSALAN